MARRPEFDRVEVVDAALGVFWSEGFPGTSLRDLREAMGLQSGSIYAAFGSKEGVFREALERYVSQARRVGWRAEDGPRERIARWFRSHIDAALGGGGRGCLLLHAATELSHHDEETRALIRRELGRLTAFFAACVSEARPELGAAAVSDRAHLLVAALAGISTLSRAGAERETLEGAARAALAVVDR